MYKRKSDIELRVSDGIDRGIAITAIAAVMIMFVIWLLFRFELIVL